jgi:PEGA domain
MRVRIVLPTREPLLWRLLLLWCLLLLPTTLSSQMPREPGVLAVMSSPPGATITINGKLMKPQTDAKFVVSPGTYHVVIDGTGSLHCDKNVKVASGMTTTVNCP